MKYQKRYQVDQTRAKSQLPSLQVKAPQLLEFQHLIVLWDELPLNFDFEQEKKLVVDKNAASGDILTLDISGEKTIKVSRALLT